MSGLAFLDIGFSEMLVVAFVALILFGGRLPEVMRSLGASYRSFRRGMEDMTRQVTRPDLGLKPPAVPYQPIPPPAASLPPGAVAPPSPPPPGWMTAAPGPAAAQPLPTTGSAPTPVAQVAPAPAPTPVPVPVPVPVPTATPPPPLPAPRVRVEDDDTPDV